MGRGVEPREKERKAATTHGGAMEARGMKKRNRQKSAPRSRCQENAFGLWRRAVWKARRAAAGRAVETMQKGRL